MSRLVVIVMASALLLSGCGGAGALDDITVSGDSDPTVEVPEGFETTSTETRVVKDGGGEEVAEGDTVKAHYVAVNGRTGEQFDNSFSADSPLTFALTEGSVLPGFVKGLEGQKVGSRVLVVIPPEDGFDGAQEQLGIEADDSMVFLFDIVSKVPEEASGEEQDVPSSVPGLVLEDGKPTGFEKTSKTADAPKEGAESRSWTAIEGEGDEIAEGATVSTHYVGQVYPDGEVFDESWSSAPRSFELATLYPCWQEQIPGKTVGSRVIIECPPGTGGQSPPPGADEDDTLIFVVDLLDAS